MAINELTTIDMDDLMGRLPSLRDLSLRELADKLGLSDQVRDYIQIDRPDLWSGGFLPVLPGRYWEYVSQYATHGKDQATPFWITVRELGPTSVLVPSVEMPGEHRFWMVMLKESAINTPRPVMFSIDQYRGTFQVAPPCIPDKGECIPYLCTGSNHHCVKYYGDDPKRGGRYFWCECEEK